MALTDAYAVLTPSKQIGQLWNWRLSAAFYLASNDHMEESQQLISDVAIAKEASPETRMEATLLKEVVADTMKKHGTDLHSSHRDYGKKIYRLYNENPIGVAVPHDSCGRKYHSIYTIVC